MNTGLLKRRINALQIEFDRLRFCSNMSCVDEPRRKFLLRRASELSRRIDILTLEVNREPIPIRIQSSDQFDSLWGESVDAELREEAEK